MKEVEDKTDIEVGILTIDFKFNKDLQGDRAYVVNVFRKPERMVRNSRLDNLKHLVYETLYERVSGWSGNDNL